MTASLQFPDMQRNDTQRRVAFPSPIVNAMTIDVEDWVQSVLDPNLPLTDHFVRNTHRILGLLDRHGVCATFFVLGLAAEKAPRLIRAIQSAGHEIHSHGYGHRLLHTLSRDEVVDDVTRSKNIIEDITGEAVTAYRAPAFSITRANPWVLDVLLERGYSIDSSIVPARTRRYGIAGAPWYPHRLRTPGGGTIIEAPVATATLFGRRVPAGGGGYLRLYPAAWVERAIRKINKSGQPATVYMHPYELNPDELTELPHPIPWKLRLHQGLGRRGLERKIERLLSSLHFGPLRDALSLDDLPIHDPHWETRTADRAHVLMPRSPIQRAPSPPVPQHDPIVG